MGKSNRRDRASGDHLDFESEAVVRLSFTRECLIAGRTKTIAMSEARRADARSRSTNLDLFFPTPDDDRCSVIGIRKAL
jgi:hypothetical protein